MLLMLERDKDLLKDYFFPAEKADLLRQKLQEQKKLPSDLNYKIFWQETLTERNAKEEEVKEYLQLLVFFTCLPSGSHPND